MATSALITGASSGLGEALARALVAEGWDVAVTARRLERLQSLAAELSEAHPEARIEALPVDVDDPEAVRTVMHMADQRLDGLDLVVANAGVGAQAEGHLGDPDHARRAAHLIRTNLGGAVATIATAVELMRPRGRGHIVAMSSVASARGLPWSPSYSASKIGLNAYVEALRAALTDVEIDFTVLKPGYVQTEIFDDGDRLPDVIGVDEAVGPMMEAIRSRAPEAVIPPDPWTERMENLRTAPLEALHKLTPPSRRNPRDPRRDT